MITDPLYWYWKSELPESVCDAIISEGLKLTAAAAVVGGENGGVVDPSIRISKTAFFNSNSWISAITSHYMRIANESAAWNFAITGPQDPQFTIYDTAEFYGFHTDESKFGSSMRKLSMVIFITDPSKYEGGDFEFDGLSPGIRERGSILVFPSFVLHRVSPVTSGTRYSIVNWFTGPSFV